VCHPPVPTSRIPEAANRLTDILRALPQGELDGLIERLAIRIDPAKRIDVPSQVARALVSLPDLRDTGRLNPACVELMHRVAEARGSLLVSSVPPGLEPLLARGLMFARASGVGVELILPAAYLVQLKAWEGEDPRGMRALLSQAGADGITIFDAVDKQLGLKLELQKLPTPVIVVDSVNQKPTGNPPGVTENLPPPPPAEFEVADIKPSQPGAGVNGAIQPGGRINLQSFTLKMLIDIAWDINGDEMLVGAPKWLDSDRFDIVAKASTAGPSPDVDFDDLRLMVRALLADRFKLATHTEDREISAYTLVAAKPKLTKADPLNRTGCKEGPAPGAKDLRDVNPVLARLLTCQNMTMAQFAEQLPSLASGYIHSPVMDATGIEGAWDFTLNFSPIGLFQSAGVRVGDPGQPAGAAPAASDPSGALSLFDAVSKQLGLKLEMHKRSVPVLVIDHVEQKPTEN